MQNLKELDENAMYVQKLKDFKSLWNVQIRGADVCADSKGVTECDFEDVVYVQILRELAQIGMERVIADWPHGGYHESLIEFNRNYLHRASAGAWVQIRAIQIAQLQLAGVV